MYEAERVIKETAATDFRGIAVKLAFVAQARVQSR